MERKIPDATDVLVGNRVRLSRQELGMSQTALGQAIGVTFQQVQKYEKGLNRISASRLQGIANVMKVAVPFLFQDVQAGTSPRSIEELVTSDDIRRFLCSDDGSALVRALLRIRNVGVRTSLCDLVKELAK